MTTKAKPARVSVSLPRELWEQVVELAAAASPRTSAAALLEHWVRLGMQRYSLASKWANGKPQSGEEE